eukprot:363593-Chlamydomonas_euryale.AAC.7
MQSRLTSPQSAPAIGGKSAGRGAGGMGRKIGEITPAAPAQHLPEAVTHEGFKMRHPGRPMSPRTAL